MEIPINKLEDCLNMAKTDVINTNYYGLKTRRPTFTTKHHVKIAAHMANIRVPVFDPSWHGDVEAMADMFAKDNQRFKRPHFYELCGLYTDGLGAP